MLHPQAQALLRLMEEKKIPPTHTLTPQQAREYYRVRRAVTQPEPPEVALVRELQATGPAGAIPLRLYRPAGSREDEVLPVLV
jgi:acetyl esterase